MADDILVNKAATIERAVRRAREEYRADPATFAQNFTRQDAAVMNIQRACEAALDMGQYLIRRDKLGVPQSSRQVFDLLAAGGRIHDVLSTRLKKMVGYRNIAVHEYQELLLPVTVAIIEHYLDDLLVFSAAILQRQ